MQRTGDRCLVLYDKATQHHSETFRMARWKWEAQRNAIIAGKNTCGYDWVNHRVADIPGAFDGDKVVIGLDWYKTCTPLLQSGSFWAPTPLFVQQLRDISTEHPVQFVIVSFSGYQGIVQELPLEHAAMESKRGKDCLTGAFLCPSFLSSCYPGWKPGTWQSLKQPPNLKRRECPCHGLLIRYRWIQRW